MSKGKKTDLLIIDPQWDFCDPNGSLSVPGAADDMKRISDMIDRMGKKINQIHITLDCHYPFDIAHNIMWRDSTGNILSPFTTVTHKMVVDGQAFPIYQQL